MSEAVRFGIKENRAVNYHSDREGTEVNYKALSKTVSMVRSCEAHCLEVALEGWDEEIRADYCRRKK